VEKGILHFIIVAHVTLVSAKLSLQ